MVWIDGTLYDVDRQLAVVPARRIVGIIEFQQIRRSVRHRVGVPSGDVEALIATGGTKALLLAPDWPDRVHADLWTLGQWWDGKVATGGNEQSKKPSTWSPLRRCAAPAGSGKPSMLIHTVPDVTY